MMTLHIYVAEPCCCEKRGDRDKKGGWVIIAYKKEIQNLTMVVKEEYQDCEMLWNKINNGKVTVIVGVTRGHYPTQSIEENLQTNREKGATSGATR